MKISIIGYGVLVALAIYALFLPWYSVGKEIYNGWELVLSFSFPYLIGIILSIITLVTRRSPLGLTIVGGILMLIGVILAISMAGSWKALTGRKITVEDGMALAFVISIVYPIMGSILCQRWKT